MKVTAFRLGDILLMPINHKKGHQMEHVVDKSIYAVPGRTRINRDQIPELAKRMGVVVRQETQHLVMPLHLKR